MESKCNKSIECTVCECTHHANNDNYCTLNTVSIGTHEPNPTKKECVDCRSFIVKG